MNCVAFNVQTLGDSPRSYTTISIASGVSSLFHFNFRSPSSSSVFYGNLDLFSIEFRSRFLCRVCHHRALQFRPTIRTIFANDSNALFNRHRIELIFFFLVSFKRIRRSAHILPTTEIFHSQQPRRASHQRHSMGETFSSGGGGGECAVQASSVISSGRMRCRRVDFVHKCKC